MAGDALRLWVKERFRDSLRPRFLLQDSMGRDYTVTHNSRLEFKVCAQDRVVVEVEAVDVRRVFGLKGLLWRAPTQFRVLLEGVERGFLERSALWPLRRDVLVLDGHTYLIPGYRRGTVARLGVNISWGFGRLKPLATVECEEAILPGLLLMAYSWVRARYDQD